MGALREWMSYKKVARLGTLAAEMKAVEEAKDRAVGDEVLNVLYGQLQAAGSVVYVRRCRKGLVSNSEDSFAVFLSSKVEPMETPSSKALPFLEVLYERGSQRRIMHLCKPHSGQIVMSLVPEICSEEPLPDAFRVYSEGHLIARIHGAVSVEEEAVSAFPTFTLFAAKYGPSHINLPHAQDADRESCHSAELGRRTWSDWRTVGLECKRLGLKRKELLWEVETDGQEMLVDYQEQGSCDSSQWGREESKCPRKVELEEGSEDFHYAKYSIHGSDTFSSNSSSGSAQFWHKESDEGGQSDELERSVWRGFLSSPETPKREDSKESGEKENLEMRQWQRTKSWANRKRWRERVALSAELQPSGKGCKGPSIVFNSVATTGEAEGWVARLSQPQMSKRGANFLSLHLNEACEADPLCLLLLALHLRAGGRSKVR